MAVFSVTEIFNNYLTVLYVERAIHITVLLLKLKNSDKYG